jgi:hypothetical protein
MMSNSSTSLALSAVGEVGGIGAAVGVVGQGQATQQAGAGAAVGVLGQAAQEAAVAAGAVGQGPQQTADRLPVWAHAVQATSRARLAVSVSSER